MQNSDDREEDGFVLLGETAIERSTVLPDRSPLATEYLPSYNVCIYNNRLYSPQHRDTSISVVLLVNMSYNSNVHNITKQCKLFTFFID